MCLIIRCDKNIPLNKALVEHWQEKNGDGWGMMWLQDNHIMSFKSMEVAALWDKYVELQAYDPVIHLRWRTHGDTDLNNCHPYYCGHGIFLMHNGIISDASNRQKEKSDTWHFVEDWLKNLFALTKNPHQTIRSEVFRKMFEKEIGTNNRIILGDRGGFVSFNDKAWHTIDNEDTGVKGLVVSNTYAWDAFRYGKPVIEYTHHHTSHYSGEPTTSTHRHGYYMAPVPRIDGSLRNTLGAEMFLVVGNIYIDIFQGVWLWVDQTFKRCPQMDKPIRRRIKKELKQQEKQESTPPPSTPQQTVLSLPAPVMPELGTSGLIAVNAADMDIAEAEIEEYTANEYTNILVKQWQGESKAAIHSLTYTDPDDAAKVICHLLGKH
jgi:hypothetical protein